MRVVTDRERHRRVEEEDSRRKRDLAGWRRIEALRARERAEALQVCDDAASAWRCAVHRLRAVVPENTFELWIKPISLAGAEERTLFLSVVGDLRTWIEGRYGSLIREALQGTDYTDVEFVDSPEGVTACR